MAPPQSDGVPSARVFREAGRLARPLPVPFSKRARIVLDPVGRGARAALHGAVGMWPLTAILLMAALLLIMAGHGASPT
jgi:hypothetical protein